MMMCFAVSAALYFYGNAEICFRAERDHTLLIRLKRKWCERKKGYRIAHLGVHQTKDYGVLGKRNPPPPQKKGR